MAAQPPQQTIENCKTPGIAVQDRGLRQLDKFGRYVEGALGSLKRWCCGRWFEKLGLAALHHPCHAGWRHIVHGQRACRFTPAVEIGLAVECDEMHRALSLLRAKRSNPFFLYALDCFASLAMTAENGSAVFGG